MTPTSRALCAELLQFGDQAGEIAANEGLWPDCDPGPDWLLDRARAELAKPDPVAPTDDEIDEQTATLIPWLLEKAVQAADSDQPYAAGKLTLAAQLLGELRPTIQPEPVAPPMLMPGDAEGLAEVFWGRYDRPEPVAPTPTDEEIGEWHDQCADLTRLGEVDHYWAFDLRSDEVAGVVRAALARWGTPANTISQEDY